MADQGEHHSLQLETGEEVHLVRPPHGLWRIKQYDWSWPDNGILLTDTVYAQDLGWENRDFQSRDAAYQFVADQLRAGIARGVPPPMRDHVGRRQ